MNAQAKRQKTAKKFNKTHKIVPLLKAGTRVLVLDEKKTSKHDQNWVGPYVIDSVNDTGSYLLRDDLGDTLRRARAQIKPFHEKPENQEQRSYRVDYIIKHRGQGKKAQYLVKWTGFGHSENSWVKTEDFDDMSLIRAYWDKKAPKRATKQSQKKSKLHSA
jgi:hypothetical protein